MPTPIRSPRTAPSAGRRALRGIAGAACALAALALAPAAQAVPLQGSTPWSVLLCKYSDQPQEPQAPAFFRNFVTEAGAGLGGNADYFADQSRERIDMGGSNVRGWYTMPVTLATAVTKSRWDRIQDCVNAASAGGYAVPAGHRIMAIVNAQVDAGASGGRVLLDPGAWNVGFAAHEMLHGYGLGHSFSDDLTYQNASWSQPGEYDDEWDEMSAMHIFAFATANFGTSAVGLNGHHLDVLGWLGRSEVLTLGANGAGSVTTTLTALEDTGAGTRLIRIPFDPGDLFHYYTVEFRRRTGWSAEIPRSTVLIHEVQNGRSTVLRWRNAERSPVDALSRNGVSIRVNGGGSVTVTSDIVARCLQGYVWREARPGDRVCVLPATRARVRADNAAAAGRWVSGPYGPHTCIQGYVWREAFPGDDVCVVGAQRTLAGQDNAAAASRRNPARLVYGPNTCKSGYVWREADDRDWVCVSGAVRAQTRADNAAAAGRWVPGPYGPHTCIQGFGWRAAFPGDAVCVTPAQRRQTRSENAAAASRMEKP
jgi:hypothetical protein